MAQSKQFTFSVSILLSTTRKNTLIRRGKLVRKNTLKIDFATGIQIKRASSSSNCQSKGFQTTSNKLTRFTTCYTHKTPTKMFSPPNAAILLLLVLVVNIHYSLASGRPRRCYPEDCEVSAWSSWSSCSSSMSDERKLESRSRSITTPSCTGKACRRKLKESRLCYESNTQNGQGMGEEFCSIVKRILTFKTRTPSAFNGMLFMFW